MDENGTARSLERNYLTPATAVIDRLLARPAHGEHGPLDDAVIHAIHRGPAGSGYIPLAVKDNGTQWRELGALQIGQPMLPNLLAALAQDAYFGLNSSFRAGKKFARAMVTRDRWEPIRGEAPPNPWAGKSGDAAKRAARAFDRELANSGPAELKTITVERSVPKPNPLGLPWQQHDAQTLRWLNVAYADLDCYNVGLDVGATVGAIISLQDRGEIPPPTIIARSGRGVWAFWFLLDARNPTSGQAVVYGQTHEPHTSQRASARALALYARVQRAIVEKLAHLGADLGAVDGPRYAPFPGTLKTSSENRVLYWPQVTARGVPAYTLAELAAGLGLELQAREHPVIESALSLPDDDTSKAKRHARAVKGWRKRWLYAVSDLEILRKLRDGTFNADGVSRNVAALYYAVVLTRAGMPPADVTARVNDLGARCGLTTDEIAAALKQARKRGLGHFLSGDRLRRDLRVTDVEATYLRPRPSAPVASSRKDDIAARRAAIRQEIAKNGGTVPSTRRMAEHLQQLGIRSGNHTTVFKDYRALGFQPTARPGRPKLPGL